MLTGNEHCNDYGTYGLKRTLDILKNRGLDTLGTTSTDKEDKFLIRDLNGIQVGMLCYTQADTDSGRDTPTINKTTLDSNGAGLLNCFDDSRLDDFYSEMEQHIAAMKEAGAEAIVLYIHWGKEYTTSRNDTQAAMAQKLCDLGVDVIVGDHTHTVQPIELLTATDTLCAYRRIGEGETLTVVLNCCDSMQTVDFTGQPVLSSYGSKTFDGTLLPWEAVILKGE